MKFIKREYAPSKDDAHFYSNNIFYRCGFGLPNCTCYAWGRFYELLETLGIEGVPKLQTSNAENWYEDERFYEKGKVPKLGAVIVWKQGSYHYSLDGMGHVGIVEEIKDNGNIIVSQSGYTNKKIFYLTEHNNKYEKPGYQFEGFIYLPKEFDKNIIVNKIEEETITDFKIGDKVLVLNGRATASSDGSGTVTAEYDGNINDNGNIKYITSINEKGIRPYHLSNNPVFGKGNRGWVSATQIKKI